MGWLSNSACVDLIEKVHQHLTSSKASKQLRENIQLFVVIGQLNQLIKGGRISKTKGLIRYHEN